MKTTKLDVIGFAAFSGTGKTTLAAQVIANLNRKGFRIGVIKHAHHSFNVDTPGKDSYELRQAGAEQVLIGSKQRIALVLERGGKEEPGLDELLGFYVNRCLDLVIVEGLKREPFPKIEVHRGGLKRPLLAVKDKHVIAVATDAPEAIELDIVKLDINSPEAIADFIVTSKEQGRLVRIVQETPKDGPDSP